MRHEGRGERSEIVWMDGRSIIGRLTRDKVVSCKGEARDINETPKCRWRRYIDVGVDHENDEEMSVVSGEEWF